MALADQSLIRVEETEGATRFRLLDTIREFAAERLAASGEQAEVEARHSAWFLRLVEVEAPRLAGDDQRQALGRIERDHDNIRAVIERATTAEDAGLAIPIAFAMWRYWQKRGHLAEALRRVEAIASQPWSHADPLLRARLMEALGGIGWWRADAETMVPAYREALELWRSIGDKREIANALYNLSFQNAVLSDRVERASAGTELQDEALAMYREIGDERGQANVLWALGNYLYVNAKGDHGVEHFREALAIFERVGERTMEAWAQHMLGSALLRLGDLEGVHAPLRAALRRFHDAGDVSGIAISLDDLASESIAHGDLQRAARLWGAARALSTAGGIGLADFVESAWEPEYRPSAKAAIEPAELERYGAEGRAMSLDEAVAYALDMPVEDLPGPHEHVGGTRG